MGPEGPPPRGGQRRVGTLEADRGRARTAYLAVPFRDGEGTDSAVRLTPLFAVEGGGLAHRTGIPRVSRAGVASFSNPLAQEGRGSAGGVSGQAGLRWVDGMVGRVDGTPLLFFLEKPTRLAGARPGRAGQPYPLAVGASWAAKQHCPVMGDRQAAACCVRGAQRHVGTRGVSAGCHRTQRGLYGLLHPHTTRAGRRANYHTCRVYWLVAEGTVGKVLPAA